MVKLTNPLPHVQIAAPCQANWDEMYAFSGERVRHCSQCRLNVYNLSAMHREEAEALLLTTEGRLCVRFYRRADGTILTQNCPVGWRALKQRVSWWAQLGLGMVIGLLANVGLMSLAGERMLGLRPQPMMGAIAMPLEERQPVAETSELVQGQVVNSLEQKETPRLKLPQPEKKPIKTSWQR